MERGVVDASSIVTVLACMIMSCGIITGVRSVEKESMFRTRLAGVMVGK